MNGAVLRGPETRMIRVTALAQSGHLDDQGGSKLRAQGGSRLLGQFQVKIDDDEQVGPMLSLMQSKSSRSIKSGRDNGKARAH